MIGSAGGQCPLPIWLRAFYAKCSIPVSLSPVGFCMSAIVYDCSWFFTLLPNMFFCWAQGRKCEGKNHREREVVTKLRFAPVSPLPKVLPLAHVSLCETAQFAPQTCAPSFLTFSPLSDRLLLVWNQRGNLKRGERISETKLSALSPLLWFPLRFAPLRPAEILAGQKVAEARALILMFQLTLEYYMRRINVDMQGKKPPPC